VLESLREPLETGVVTVSRAARQLDYPARFQLVAAMNPCPCGHLGDVSGRCRCAPPEIARYRARISGPLLDRIDLRVEVPSLPHEELLEDLPVADVLTTAAAAARVRAARALQLARVGKLNADLTVPQIQRLCALDRPCRALVAQAKTRLGLSARGVHRAMRVARTIADLETTVSEAAASGTPGAAASGVEQRPLSATHLAEALQLRRPIL
jgi:magnesium chelatase family protein